MPTQRSGTMSKFPLAVAAKRSSQVSQNLQCSQKALQNSIRNNNVKGEPKVAQELADTLLQLVVAKSNIKKPQKTQDSSNHLQTVFDLQRQVNELKTNCCWMDYIATQNRFSPLRFLDKAEHNLAQTLVDILVNRFPLRQKLNYIVCTEIHSLLEKHLFAREIWQKTNNQYSSRKQIYIRWADAIHELMDRLSRIDSASRKIHKIRRRDSAVQIVTVALELDGMSYATFAEAESNFDKNQEIYETLLQKHFSFFFHTCETGIRQKPGEKSSYFTHVHFICRQDEYQKWVASRANLRSTKKRFENQKRNLENGVLYPHPTIKQRRYKAQTYENQSKETYFRKQLNYMTKFNIMADRVGQSRNRTENVYHRYYTLNQVPVIEGNGTPTQQIRQTQTSILNVDWAQADLLGADMKANLRKRHRQATRISKYDEIDLDLAQTGLLRAEFANLNAESDKAAEKAARNWQNRHKRQIKKIKGAPKKPKGPGIDYLGKPSVLGKPENWFVEYQNTLRKIDFHSPPS